MKDILHDIIAAKRVEVAQRKKGLDAALLAEICADAPPPRSLKCALSSSPSGIIAEFKRRSPSKGWIKADADPTVIPPAYCKAGASALSILTDETFFGGSLDDLRAARPLVDIPILRKDFVIDEYQLYEARAAGADAVLLIAAAIDRNTCAALAACAHSLGLETLLEIHSESELAYVGADIDMVGVNNRNLGTFHTDVANSYRLAQLLPDGYVKISESGISKAETIVDLRKAGFRGFLIGETFMKTPSPADTLAKLIAEITPNE